MIYKASMYTLFVLLLFSCTTDKRSNIYNVKKSIIGSWKYSSDTTLQINFTKKKFFYSKNNFVQKDSKLNVDTLLYKLSCNNCFPQTKYLNEIDSFSNSKPEYLKIYIYATDKSVIKSKCFAIVYLDKDSLELYDLDHGVHYCYNK